MYFYLCCLFFCNKPKWFSCLHLVVLFSLLLFRFDFSFLSKKAAKNGHRKKKQKKGHFLSVSAVVFTNSVPNFWGGLKNAIFTEHTIKRVVSAYFEKQKNKKAPKNDPKSQISYFFTHENGQI